MADWWFILAGRVDQKNFWYRNKNLSLAMRDCNSKVFLEQQKFSLVRNANHISFIFLIIIQLYPMGREILTLHTGQTMILEQMQTATVNNWWWSKQTREDILVADKSHAPWWPDTYYIVHLATVFVSRSRTVFRCADMTVAAMPENTW